MTMHGNLFKDAKIALLGAVKLERKAWDTDVLPSLDSGGWRTDTPFLAEVSAAFEFFDSKTIFIGQQLKNPIRRSYAPPVHVTVAFAKDKREINVELCVSYFVEQEVLQILIYFNLDDISPDELIFIKELK